MTNTKTTIEAASEALLLLDQHLNQPAVVRCAQGTAMLWSQPAPDKEGPNEDAALAYPIGHHAAVLAVADGCGGASAGERAASETLRAIYESLERRPPDGAVRSAILDGVELANRRVQEVGGGAATTLSAVEIDQGTVRSYHVGDSTVLLVGSRGKVKLKTRSHSPVGYGVEAGLIEPDEAIHHDDLHVVSNVIGMQDMHIEVGPPRKLAQRDTLLIGSDGLFDNLHLEEIVDVIRKGPLEAAAVRLTELAASRMSESSTGQPSKPDDLTFVLYRP